MPRGDRTGPNGMGSKTGRSLGYCVGNNQAGFEQDNNSYGRGNRNRDNYGRGMGFGFRHGYNVSNISNLADIKEETLIKNEMNILKDQLENLEKKLKTLKDE